MKTNKIDILIVDDRPENLFAIEAILESPNYHLIKAHSGAEALKYLLDNDCALILMDVQMPDMDGFETASYIKRSQRSRNIPIIFITALNKDERFVHKGYQSGAVDYIFKPFEADILKSKVDVFVDLYKAKEEIQHQAVLLHENDLKERERALAQLELKSLKRDQASQKKYRDLVDGLHHAIIWSADSKTLAFSFVSRSAERILGFPIDHWFSEIGCFINRLHPDDRVFFLEALRKIRANSELGFEHRLIDSKGQTLWFHTGIRLARKTDSEDLELRGLSTDITQIKETEAALKKSEHRAQLIANLSLSLSETLDFESNLKKIGTLTVPSFANWYSIDILGEKDVLRSLVIAQSAAETVTLTKESNSSSFFEKNFHEGVAFVTASGKAELHNQISESFLAAIACDPESLDLLKKIKPKTLMILPLRARSHIFGAITFARTSEHYNEVDLSFAEDLVHRAATALDNAMLYQQAQHAISARDEFLSVASHELKTPLTPLMLHTQSLKRSLQNGNFAKLSEEKIAKIIDSSDRQIARLSQLIDNLLDISRINIGRLHLNLQEFSLVELAKEIVERFTAELNLTKCTVDFYTRSACNGQWDRFRLEQVIINLLTNAMKYGAGKPIHIEISEDKGIATLKVRDHGIGIDKKDQKRIFERFERAVSPSHFGGLGLGLFIVKELVNLHMGTIRVESFPGQGSTFIVEVPQNLTKETHTASPNGKRETTLGAI